MSSGACRDDRWCDAGLRILKLCKNNVNRREGAPIYALLKTEHGGREIQSPKVGTVLVDTLYKCRDLQM